MVDNNVEFTPRFKSGNSCKKLLSIEYYPDKKIQTCKNLSKFKRESYKSDTSKKSSKSDMSKKSSKSVKSDLSKKSSKSKKSHKSHKSHKSNNISNIHKISKSTKIVNNGLDIINIKNKFILRNDFDSKHSKKFLKEKFLMLEKPILIDEICN